ncbi:hypothetical protein DM02DRAFT_578792 [Periconia macrospinosa]|uniref:Uncharacterized protein n=1 Tax=Periconia macrospinosa TaxID=97972 RepID=A0A2V1EDI8_9PLEO|nr:hypothetical protein DM02DRAFT_578792 [Periconia macrospinosa]
MALSLPNTSLSANDTRILNALFDPETLPSSISRSKDLSIIDASLPSHPTIPSTQLSTLETQQNNLVRNITSSSTPSSIQDAIRQEDEIIRENPEYASAFLNRAMLRRMGMEATLSEGKSIFDLPESEVEGLFSDLSRAVALCVPSSSGSAAAVSPYQARILRTAFSHRAYLYLKAAESDVELRGKGRSELEELASGDFAAAARYGDEVAREMSVRTNPYAKMCGAIVRNALAEERKEAMTQ